MVSFKKECRQLHEAELKFFRTLINDVRAEREANAMAPSFTNTWLEEEDAYGLPEDEAAYVIGTLFEAGSGTRASAMMSFLLAMTLYPQWQEVIAASYPTFPSRACRKLTILSACGRRLTVRGDRMPDFDDVPNLPVCRDVIKEALH
jgi:cytochrome P450